MRSFRALMFLGAIAAAAAVVAQEPASAFTHGRGAFAMPKSRAHARQVARRAYYRPVARTSWVRVDAAPRVVARATTPVVSSCPNGRCGLRARAVGGLHEVVHDGGCADGSCNATFGNAAAPVVAVAPTIEYDSAGRPWIRRIRPTSVTVETSASSPAPAAASTLGGAVRVLREPRHDVAAPAPRVLPADWSAPTGTCTTCRNRAR